VIFECVINVSEGRDDATLGDIAAAAAPTLLDLHRDPHHNRAVLTLAGEPLPLGAAVRALATVTLARLDLRHHEGVHPRLGVLDVVPFAPFEPGAPPPSDLTESIALRDEFARWLGDDVGVPAYCYGPLPGGRTRTLPDIRRHAFSPGFDPPDYGPDHAEPRTGATAVGARPVLVAYNVWVSSVEVARRVAPAIRRNEIRALGLGVGTRAQVSCNLLDPVRYGPAQLYDAVASLAAEAGGAVEGAELVGLLPEVVLAAVPAARRVELGISTHATVESRLSRLRDVRP
jgi:glutamate formiminotransferase / 5-formyltetrahydrofolate cyclo-ligase